MGKNLGGRPRLSKRKRNKLTAWMRTTGTTAKALADLCEVTPSAIYALRDGKFRPGLELALRLEEVSDGAISAKSWPKPKGKVA